MRNKIFVSIFAVLLALLSVLTLALPKKDFSPNENRMLATFPKLTAETLKSGKFTLGVSDYLTDHYVLRDFWVSLKTVTTLAVGKKENNGVYLGKGHTMIDGFTDADTAQFGENCDALERFVAAAKSEYGVEVKTLIAPTATQILADRLPAFAVTADALPLFERLGAIPGFVDVRNVLTEHKDEYIFYRTDHHWTDLGAYLSFTQYQAARGLTAAAHEAYAPETVSDAFYGTLYSRFGLFTWRYADTVCAPADRGGVTMTNSKGEQTASIYSPAGLEGKDKYLYFLGGNDSKLEIETAANTGRSLLLVKDSYANSFLPYLIGEYDRITVVDMRFYAEPVLWLLRDGGYTDALVLYNLKSFASDQYVRFIDLSD
ncbi:MAG: hypothetical protein IJR51_11180 [Clostridia bacterium]|nr:hypothetical protein [Clostridia bacterium]